MSSTDADTAVSRIAATIGRTQLSGASATPDLKISWLILSFRMSYRRWQHASYFVSACKPGAKVLGLLGFENVTTSHLAGPADAFAAALDNGYGGADLLRGQELTQTVGGAPNENCFTKSRTGGVGVSSAPCLKSKRRFRLSPL